MNLEEIYNEWKSLFPLSEKQVQLLRNKFTTEYNFNSNHIEGNTLTYGQTASLPVMTTVLSMPLQKKLHH